MTTLNQLNPTSYRGNDRLKPAGTIQDYTQEQIDEYAKCQADPIYFIETQVKIINLDGGLVPFKLYDYQKRLIETIHNERMMIGLLPRQCGKSTTISAYIVWRMIFMDNQEILIAANKQSSALDIMKRVKVAYENVDMWLQNGVKKWNDLSFELENYNKVRAVATSGDSARGGSYNFVLIDEYAFLPKNIADDFFASVYPTIASGKTSKMAIISTPKGHNHFYKAFTDAQEGRSLFKPVEIKWNDVPGRDEDFKQKTIATFGEKKWYQEFECHFLGSSNTLIDGTVLKNLVHRTPISEIPLPMTDKKVKVYHEPVKTNSYYMTVDVSRGKGLDYSAFVVMDISKHPYEVVAAFKDDEIDPMLFPNIVFNTARIYNDAYVLIEINDIGGQVADILYNDLEYENLMWVSTNGRAGQQLGGETGRNKGVKTSAATRSLGCNTLKALVENGQILINDFDIISELSNFVLKGSKYEADTGEHDDMVMCLVNFAWSTNFPYFKELTDTDLRAVMYERQLRQIEEDLVPAGFYSTGLEDEDPMF